jgi:hypothetical protein
VDYGRDAIFITSEMGELLNEQRIQGLTRGIEFLSMLTVDWTDLLGKAVKSTVKTVKGVTGKSESSSPLKGESVQSIAEEKVKGFLGKVLEKAKKKLADHPWAGRTLALMGLGLPVLVAKLKEVLWSKEVIGGFIPFYKEIGGLLDSAEHGMEAYALNTSVGVLAQNAELIGSGIPSMAMTGLSTFLHSEMLTEAGLAVYTFGKTVASTILQILTVGISNIVKVVTTVVEFIVSWIHKLYQAWIFNGACEKCREWRRTGSGVEDFTDDFGAVMATCPLLGAFFFAVQDYIGTSNLTWLFTKKSSVVAISSIDAAGAKVFETQVIACKYLSRIGFKPKFREKPDEERYGHMLKGLDKIVEAGPPPPSRKEKWAKRAWNAVRSVF